MRQSPRQTATRPGAERLLTLIALAAIITLFLFFLKDILIPFIRLELRRDVNGAQELLRDRGALGFFAVTLVEALQMVVVFIPAEFIQISSGLSYPFPVALLLCDLGVCLGATIIFFLVRTLRVRNTALEKRRRSIDRLSAGVRTRNTVLLIYLLFFMPIIPFGAICYYAASTKLRFGRYILTVATGVIPSIVVSNLMGAAGRAFLVNDLPLWMLVLIIVLLAALLFAAIFVFLDRYCFRENDRTPDSPVYILLFAAARLWLGRRQRLNIEDELLHEARAPYILLANHESFYDFYYIHQLAHPRNPTYLVNAYYTTRPVLKTLAKKAGILSKKLFTPDASAAGGILKAVRRGYPVVIFPEGRLSPDGRSNPIVEPGGAFYQRLDADLVLVRIRGAYFSKPKWRRRAYPSDIRVTVERVLDRETVKAMDPAALDETIAATLYGDAARELVTRYPQKDRAKGLHTLLYRCADCGALYTTRGEGNALRCTACGSVHTLDEHYRLSGDIPDIPAYYDRIRALEAAELETFSLTANVETKIFGAKGGPTRRETGVCRLTPEAFSYRSGSVDFAIPTEKLPALAFSCGEEFELYHKNELYYFYPTEDRVQVARWALLADLLAARRRASEERGNTL